MRFEEPNPNQRWDSPLFVIQVDDDLPLEQISDALFNRKPPPPNMATQNVGISVIIIQDESLFVYFIHELCHGGWNFSFIYCQHGYFRWGITSKLCHKDVTHGCNFHNLDLLMLLCNIRVGKFLR